MEMKELQIPVPWGIISGTTWGNSDDYPVLMVHGIQDNAGSFHNLIPLLPQGYFYVCIDLPGHGRSSHYPKGIPFSILIYIPCIKMIVDSLKWKTFHFVGHSFGAHVGFLFIGSFPYMVTKFVTIDASPHNYSEEEKAAGISVCEHDFIKLYSRLQTQTPPVYTYEESVKRLINSRPTKISEDGARLLLKRSLVKFKDGYQYSLDQRLKLNSACFYTFKQNKSFIDKFMCPVLAVFAKETCEAKVIEVEQFKKMFANVKDLNVHIVEGNHNVHIDYPERIALYMSKFLTHQKSSL